MLTAQRSRRREAVAEDHALTSAATAVAGPRSYERGYSGGRGPRSYERGYSGGRGPRSYERGYKSLAGLAPVLEIKMSVNRP